jgi:hypothetical protein
MKHCACGILFLGVFMFGLSSCRKSQITTATLNGAIQVKEVAEDAPKFKREYKVALTEGRSMTVAIQNYGFISGISRSGELDYILFDPDRVADKVIDPALAPLVQRYCAEIEVADDAWRASRPDRYVDSEGATWVRQP